ncbi:MAG TPA: dCTP deaminase [Blastocatellia bacterium]|nr:dCTP deaminase [Blastocatellia bacterium]
MMTTETSNGRHPEPGILVDDQIREAMTEGWLVIEPFDDDALEPATYDLRVGDKGVLSTVPKPLDLREQPNLVIEPFSAAFLQTEEIISLSPRIVGRVGPRSNILRAGIFASTGPQIDPGFRGRLFVSLLNMTDHPFLIRHRDRFLTVEFHGLSRAPSRSYSGRHQNKTELEPDEINALLSRGGPAFKEIHRDLLDIQAPLKDIAAWGSEFASLVRLQQSGVGAITAAVSELKTVHSISHASGVAVPITAMGMGPFELIRDITAVVQSADGGFTATFFDANISTSGETQEEAVSNLRSLLEEVFEDLEAEPVEKLGPEPLRQLALLKRFIRRR